MEEKIRHCVWCEEEFIRIKGTNSQYCSKECYTKKAYENNKNPVGYISRTVGVHEPGCCYDEQKLAPSAQWLLDNDEGDSPRITEDLYYILSCLEELPVARYSDGRPLVNTRAYRDRKQRGIKVGYTNYRPTITEFSATKRAEKKLTGVDLKQYATAEEKVAKLEREQQNYTVWEEDDD